MLLTPKPGLHAPPGKVPLIRCYLVYTVPAIVCVHIKALWVVADVSRDHPAVASGLWSTSSKNSSAISTARTALHSSRHGILGSGWGERHFYILRLWPSLRYQRKYTGFERDIFTVRNMEATQADEYPSLELHWTVLITTCLWWSLAFARPKGSKVLLTNRKPWWVTQWLLPWRWTHLCWCPSIVLSSSKQVSSTRPKSLMPEASSSGLKAFITSALFDAI